MKTRTAVCVSVAGIVLAGCAMDAAESEPIAQVEQAETQAQREAAIATKYRANPWLGNATGGYSNLGNGASRKYTYDSGTAAIYYGDAVDSAYIVHGLIAGKYLAKSAQAGFLGYPTLDETPTYYNDGRFNTFQGGSIYWKANASSAYEVHGCILNRWGWLGYELGNLGYPTTDESTRGNQKVSKFDNGGLYYRATDGGCQQSTWPVLYLPGTDDIPSAHPVIDSASFSSDGLQLRLNVLARGSGWRANTAVYMRVTTPDSPAIWAGTVTASASGTFNYQSGTNYLNENDVRTINNYATIHAFQTTGESAVYAVRTFEGREYGSGY